MGADELRIRLSLHAALQAERRGASAAEIDHVIRVSPWETAARGRNHCRCDFPFDGLWHGRSYATKRVRPVFVEEGAEIVVITVYVYYF